MNEEQAGGELRQMPRYRCHKEVYALKIEAIEFREDGSAKFASYGPGFGVCTTKAGFRERFHGTAGMDGEPVDLGYYVRYADGYESWSPSRAFEEGYTRI